MTAQKQARQYGLWSSPISPKMLSQGLSIAEVGWGQNGSLVWLESNAGQGTIKIQPPDGQAPRILNSQLSARARVNYGGGDFAVAGEIVYFVEAGSGRIYRQPIAGGEARPVTPAFGSAASPAISPDGKWLLYVHSYEGQDSLAIVDAEGGGWPQKLVSRDDFMMQPAWHPEGLQVAWASWNHPQMPWDGTTLSMGALRLGQTGLPEIDEVSILTGGPQTAIFQPQFSPDGRYLAYVSDISGWWQIYFYDLGSGEHSQITHTKAEHGIPAWLQGMRSYGFSPDGRRMLFLRNQEGVFSLWELELQSGRERRLALGDDYQSLEQISVGADGVALIASGGRMAARLITCAYSEAEKDDAWGPPFVRCRTSSEELPAQVYSLPQPISWQGLDGGQVYGLYYPPHSSKYEGVGSPPLVVRVHSGPTSQTNGGFNPRAQFFTSRGYSVLEVNYRGSTGYGRAYREMLRGNWGIYDVQDAVSGGRHLAEQGLVDPQRLVIMGSSAGGFTVLKALQDYPGFFSAGICLYGVTNQFSLAAETHKFEAHYSDSLLGPLPQAAAVYRERSPIFFVDKIQDPIALFQGADDPVVNRKQSDELAGSLERRGVPHIYHVYAGEGHGFRQPETIEHLYRTIDQFLRQHVIYV